MRSGKPTTKRGNSKLEVRFRKAWDDIVLLPLGIITQVDPKQTFPQHTFAPGRRWAFDFAWPSVKLAVELNGGTHTRGRHTRGKGVEADYEKINEAQRLGWMVLQFGSSHVSSHRKTRQVVRYVAQILQERINARIPLPINSPTPPKAVGSPRKSVVKKKSNVPQSKRKNG